jgi:hypothetical protein
MPAGCDRVGGPLRATAQTAAIAVRLTTLPPKVLRVGVSWTRCWTRICRWSCRFSPTPGRSWTGSVPVARSRANTGSGWTPFCIVEHFAFSQAAQTAMVSMVFEGVFDAFPTLKVVLVEAGFAVMPAVAWRLDREWDHHRAEVPHLQRCPSECIRDDVWLTTVQPVTGATLLFSRLSAPGCDYSHAMILRNNAVEVFRLGG